MQRSVSEHLAVKTVASLRLALSRSLLSGNVACECGRVFMSLRWGTSTKRLTRFNKVQASRLSLVGSSSFCPCFLNF